MSTADFLIAQMAGEADFYAMVFDTMLFNPSPHSLTRSPESSVYDDGSNQALPYSLSGFSGEHKSHGVSFQNRPVETEEDLYLCNTGYENPPTALDPVIDTASSTSNIDNQTLPSSALPSESIPKEPKKSSTKPNPSSEKSAKVVPKAKRQSKPEATRANNNQTKETKTKNPRERSLQRNRVAASGFRKRKREWTENLEQKKSGLEAIHSDLQSEHMDLLQESSQLKNLLISHASCQDPNVDGWIRNEASKYVRNLHSPNRVNRLKSKCLSVARQERGSMLYLL